MDSSSVFKHSFFTAGPLTQWELIFYGTEYPPQEYDASLETNSLGNSGYVEPTWKENKEPESIEEVRQNGIEDDLALVWHDSHTVCIIFCWFNLLTDGTNTRRRDCSLKIICNTTHNWSQQINPKN